MNSRFRDIVAVLLAAIVAGEASAVEIAPVTLILEREKPIAALRIRNDETRQAVYQLSGYRWRQEQGRDFYERDDDFIVTPPLVRLEPGEEALIRVGLVDFDRQDEREQAFRLFVNDVTPAEKKAGNRSDKLKLRVQLVLPVFLPPVKRKEPSIRFDIWRETDGRLCVSGQNDGDSHMKLIWVADSRAPENKIMTPHYYLAGESARICAEAPGLETAPQSFSAGLTSAYQPGVTSHEIRNHRPQTPSDPGE